MEMIIINLITSLEVYLKDTFLDISQYITVEDISDKGVFVTFLSRFFIKNKYFELFSKYGDNYYPLSELIPFRVDFQQKRKLVIAYKLLLIDLENLVTSDIWNNIFDKKDGYISKRHKIVHNGFFESINSIEYLDKEFIKKATIEICQFVYELDKVIVSKYPKNKYPDLYPESPIKKSY
ncbi:MAG: hypothetical protein FJ150_03145 [Euryarchaeota archaeon]|nr:hypothetical protein [Euryarchaeota archaeon]